MGLRKSLLLLTAVFAVLLFIERPASWLFDPDEARYTEIPQQMIASGDFLTPRLNGTNYFEKPPLLYWLNAASLKILGDTPFAARFPVRLAALATACLLLLLLRSPSSSGHLWAALIFLSSLFPFAMGRINITDGLVSFGITLTLLASRAYILAREKNKKGSGWLILIGIGASVGVLSKGVIGLFLPGMILMLWAFFTDRWPRFEEMFFSRATVLFLLLSAPWFVGMELKHPGFSKIFFIREHLLRYTTDEAHRTGSLFYFVPVLIVGMLPWTFFLLSSLKPLLRFRSASWRHDSDEFFYGLWLVVIFVFFSFSHSKLIPYVLPAFPAAALLAGNFIADKENELNKPLIFTALFWSLMVLGGMLVGSRGGLLDRFDLRTSLPVIAAVTLTTTWLAVLLHRRFKIASLFVLSFGWVALYGFLISVVPRLAADYSLHTMALKAKETKSDYVVAFATFPHSFPLVLNRPIPVVNYQGELATDGVMSPDLFWSTEKFLTIWNSTQTVVVVCRREQQDFFARKIKPAHIVSESRKFVLVTNDSASESTVSTSGKS